MNPIVYYIKQTLHGYYPDSEIVSMAKLLLTQVFGMSVIELYAGKDNCFSSNEQKQLEDILLRLQKYEPIQYIIGEEEFLGLPFEVNRHVLIPRPETGELVNWIIQKNKDRQTRILDIGTGSGCIAISLAKHMEKAQVTAWDVSEDALQVAARNCLRNGVEVKLEQKDVLRFEPSGEQFDVIVSNPPYITEKEKAEMEANVLEWEPGVALFVPDDSPLLFYRKIAELGMEMLAPDGKLYFEINRAYGKQTVDMLAELGYREIELRKDISQNDRMVKAER
ncbi:peptide chain release factor N(5)-glutamine methyltransferase [Phocaeicola sp.]